MGALAYKECKVEPRKGRFEVTSLPGAAYLWLGLIGQVVLVVSLAVASGVSSQAWDVTLAAIGFNMLIYFLIDVAYVVTFEVHFINCYYVRNGFPEEELTTMDRNSLKHVAPLITLFFVYASLANAFVVILPAIDQKVDYWAVALRGFVMGMFSYGNLSSVNAWSYKNYPLEFVGMLPLSGGLFSLTASTLTTLICRAMF